jgi:hypothetical protein
MGIRIMLWLLYHQFPMDNRLGKPQSQKEILSQIVLPIWGRLQRTECRKTFGKISRGKCYNRDLVHNGMTLAKEVGGWGGTAYGLSLS